MKFCILVTALLGAFLSKAQHFKAEAPLASIENEGFCRILLPPPTNAYLNDRLTNVRIYNSAGKEVPYLLQEERPSYEGERFKAYSIVEKKVTPGCCTTLILNNPDRKPINNISILIRNAEVSKHATLRGSDDRQNWYALKEHFVLHSISNSTNTSEIKVIDFPLSNYNFYSLTIADSTSAPLNIISAGYYEAVTSAGQFTAIPFQKIMTYDSIRQKETYIQLSFDTTYFSDKIELAMGGTPYFLRDARLYEKQMIETKQGEKEYFRYITSFEVSSTEPTMVYLPKIKAREFRIVISNEDNPSLELDTAKAFQLNRYLVAWLKKDESYVARFSEFDTKVPDYDLTFFKDSIPDYLVTVKLGDVKLLGDEMTAESSPTFFTSKYIIWLAIVLVIILLGFLSVRLAREAGVSQNRD